MFFALLASIPNPRFILESLPCPLTLSKRQIQTPSPSPSPPPSKIQLPQTPQKFTLQDHQRAALLASSHSNFDPSGQPEVLPDTLIPLTHVQEERKLREEVTRAFHTAIPASGAGSRVVKGKGKGEGEDELEDEAEDEDDFLVTKTTLQVDDAEAKKYRDFLLAQAGGEEGVREILGMGGFPERMQGQGQTQGKRAVKAEDGEEVAGDANANVDDAEGREGKGGDGKWVRTKDDDEEFLMK